VVADSYVYIHGLSKLVDEANIADLFRATTVIAVLVQQLVQTTK
jgi:hypothetical protein